MFRKQYCKFGPNSMKIYDLEEKIDFFFTMTKTKRSVEKI